MRNRRDLLFAFVIVGFLFNAAMDFVLWFSTGFVVPAWTLASVVVASALLVYVLKQVLGDKS